MTRRQSLSAWTVSPTSTTSPSTIRTICRRAGLSVPLLLRKLHTDKDDLVGRVFDWVVAELVATTQAAAVTMVLAREQTSRAWPKT